MTPFFLLIRRLCTRKSLTRPHTSNNMSVKYTYMYTAHHCKYPVNIWNPEDLKMCYFICRCKPVVVKQINRRWYAICKEHSLFHIIFYIHHIQSNNISHTIVYTVHYIHQLFASDCGRKEASLCSIWLEDCAHLRSSMTKRTDKFAIVCDQRRSSGNGLNEYSWSGRISERSEAQLRSRTGACSQM